MAIANLAMATGNIGREGVGVNPLRGQNNVQGSCDMGSFPHEFSGYRHVSDDATREMFERLWGVALSNEPGLRIPNMIDEAVEGAFKGLYIQGEDIAQSDPDTKHITAGLRAMECVIVQDLFLNETARYAHVFLPGASFLEKDGTFINAERRISRVRKAIHPLAGKADWEATMALAKALGVPMHYAHPSEIMDEIAATTPTFSGVSYARLDELGSIQWPCNDAAPTGTPIMHVDHFVRGKGQFMLTEYVATEERVGPRFPLLLTTGRILSQYNVGAQTRRTANAVWHEEDVLEIHPFDAEQRGVRDGDLVALQAAPARFRCAPRSPSACSRASSTRPSIIPSTGANVVTTDNSDWATNCPEYKVTAVQVRRTNHFPTGRCATAKKAFRCAGSRRRWPMRPSDGPGLDRRSGPGLFLRFAAPAAPSPRRAVAVEAPVQIVIGGAPFAVMMATPQDLEDFAYGFALTERSPTASTTFAGSRSSASRTAGSSSSRSPASGCRRISRAAGR